MSSATAVAPPPSQPPPTSLALPKEVLDNVKPAEEFPAFRLKWLSNEEVVSVLINYNAHSSWMSSEVEQRPANGTLLLVNRKATKYKKDGYCWKVRKDSRVIREDTIRLKVHAFDIVKCLYAHSSLISTFHRRSYCLFVNPDVVLVHYLNELQEISPLAMLDSVAPLTTVPLFWPPGRDWNKQELQGELIPMFKNCHDEQGKLPLGIRSVEQLVESILEDSRKRNSFVDSNPTPKAGLTSGYQRSRSVRNFSAQSSLILPLESTSSNSKTKYRPICANTTTSSAGTANIAKIQPQQTLPVVLNIQHIQPVLALVQSKTADVSSSGGSTCVLSVQSVQTPASSKSPSVATAPESPVPSSVLVASHESKLSTCGPETDKCEIATQTVPTTPERDDAMFDKSPPPTMPHGFAASTPNSGFSPLSVAVETSPCFAHQGNFHSVNSHVLSSELPLRSFENSSADVNLQSLTVDAGINYPRTEAIDASHPVVYTSYASPFAENAFETSNNNYARSRSEASDLGFSETTEFSPNLCYNQNSNKPSNPMLGSYQGIANYTPAQRDCQLSSGLVNPNYEVKTFHCNSFSSHGQISSIGTISSSSSASLRMESNAYYELNVAAQENHQQASAVVTEQVAQQSEMVAQVSDNLVEFPNQISEHQHMNSFQNSGGPEVQSVHIETQVMSNEELQVKEVYSVVDLPDLSAMAGFNEQMTQLSSGNAVQHDQINQQNLFTSQSGSLDELTYITEYSPSWCYEEGGEKILIAGNWPQGSSGDLFQCHFGNKTSPAALILPGVLRCLSPGSNCGIVPLAISRNGHFITHSVPFEYRPKPTSRMDSDWFKVSANNSDWLALNDHEFRFRLLSRLNEMQTHLMSFIGNGAPNGSQNSSDVANNLFGSSQDSTSNSESMANFEVQFERQFSVILQLLAHLKETNSSHAMTELPRPPRGLTMLHLAAALGMPRLIDTMRSCLPQIGGLSDLNPATLDDQHCSALSWACARGNLECALILHNWCHEMLSARNRFDLTPLMIAKMRGHVLLVETLADKETGAERRHGSHNPNGKFKKRCPESLATPSRGPSIDPNVFHDDSDDVSSCSEYDSEDICSLGSVPTMAESMSQQTSDIAGVNGGMDVDSPVGPACSCPIHGNREMNGRGGQLVSSDVDDDASSPLITTSLQVYNLAEQIIRAIPERIKNSRGEESPEVRAAFDSSSRPRMPNNYDGMTPLSSGGQTSDINAGGLFHGTPLGPFMSHSNIRGERLPSFENSFTNWDCGRGAAGGAGTAYNWCGGSDCSSFDLFSDEFDYNEFELGSDTGSDYRRRGGTVNSETTHVHQSQGGGVGGCDSPMEDLAEFIQGRGNVEAELNSLTLSDSDQRTLYESAKIIQSAFRQYKQCRQKRQQEIEAAILIQSYFRKYRQYFSYKRMCRAARLIQKVFRRYKYNSYGPHTSSHPRFSNIVKGNLPSATMSAMTPAMSGTAETMCPRAAGVGGGSSGNRRRSSSIISYLTKHDIDQAVLLVQRNYRRRAKRRRENDAALKIQRFLRQCRNKVQALRCDTTNPPSVMRYLISQ
ncbi:calmodulin-binding transcription activator 2-like isoform X2 [Convolutriloba macropyga]|uniref:calmodulin-binding transcription activator 2-like isoform X2 n=1 Tax=Convolutriloba macropyga TaxID=536237 RepID=UPI003F51BCDA